MNIAVNCRLLQKDRLEGIGWFMYETLKRLTRDHPEHKFFFIFDRQYDDEFIFASNVTPVVVGPPTRHPVLWYYWLEWKLPGVLKSIKADLFFSPDGFLSLKSKVPSIPVIHDINFAHRPQDLPFWTRHYYNFFFPLFARKAKRICTVSMYSKMDINTTYMVDLPLIHVVYNGANKEFSPIEETEKQGIRDKYTQGQKYFIFIGSIHPRKNLRNLILAYNKFISKTGSEIKLLIVGSAMWKKEKVYHNLIGKDNESRIIFTGRLESEELAKVLSAALALTFVPWFEGFGIPVLEALYAHVPVLTSSETSLPEVGGDACLYAHPGDIDDISSKMELLVNDSDLRNKLINLGKEQKLMFSWDKTAEKVWNCMETVIHGIKKDHRN
jgi:glycosyltransferase involved in cell wall biosynthesis